MEQTEVEIPVEELLAERPPRQWGKWLGLGFWTLIGIALPIAALAVEATLGLCQSTFFDPIPTVWHALLIALVPLSNFLALWHIRRDRRGAVPALIVLNGAAMAVSAVYALVFIPLLSFSAMYTMMTIWAMFIPAAITLLPFAPLASLIANIRTSRQLAKHAQAWNIPARNLKLAGSALALAAMIAVEGPRAVSTIAINRLTQNSSDVGALELARRYGDVETLRAAAYGISPRDFLTWISSFFTKGGRWTDFERVTSMNRSTNDPDSLRRIFFQVTGESFNSRPLPSYRTPWFSFFGAGASDLGGTAVGALTEDVTLTQSALDASVSADTLSSYTEWTMTFHNAHEFRQHEARAELLLPKGGVVSRVTLWIAGEPVEALYGTRGSATEAYQRIVRATRDPLLVTTSGPDRVLIQCFPIEPGKDMKILIGITAPLKLENLNTGAYSIPRIIDRNFLLRNELGHRLWVESKSEISTRAAMLKAERPEENVYGLRGSVPDSESDIRIEIPIGSGPQWVQSLDADASLIVGQQIVEYALAPTNAAVVVIDGSGAMSDSVPGLVQAIAAVPEGTSLGVVIAGDLPHPLTDGFIRADSAALAQIADGVRQFRYAGGANNAAALTAAWDLAATQPGARIIWIHGASPAKFDGVDELEQRQKRRPNGPTIYSLETDRGPNRTLEQVDLLGMLYGFTGTETSLVKSFSHILTGGTTPGVAFSVRTAGETDRNTPTYQHVNRLWAAHEVQEMIRQSRKAGKLAAYPEQATNLALRFRLVTPATGAVVLAKNEVVGSELQPATPGMVPSVPEPEMYALAAVLLLLLALHTRRNRHANQVR